MSNQATLLFETAIEEIRVRVAAIEQELADPNSDVCLSGSAMLDTHYQLIGLSERLHRCARTVPPVDASDKQDALLAQWEAGSNEPAEAAWSADQLTGRGSPLLILDCGAFAAEPAASTTSSS